MSAAKSFTHRLCLTISQAKLPLAFKVKMLLLVGKRKKQKLLIRCPMPSNAVTLSWLWNDDQITEIGFQADSKAVRDVLADLFELKPTQLMSKGFNVQFKDLRLHVDKQNQYIEISYKPKKKR